MLGIGSVGDPIAATERKRAALEISYFSGLGALIVFLGGIALARLAVRLASDVEALARVRSAARRTSEPAYMSGLQSRRARCPDAMTTPGVPSGDAEDRRLAPAAADAAPGPAAAYQRWPHAQS